MSYASIVQDLPQEFQLTMIKLVEAVEQNMREQLAVRREDFDALQSVVRELAEAQKHTEERVEELAEAQKRTEQRLDRLEAVVTELVEAQRRTEEEIRKLVESQIRFEEQMRKFEIRQDKSTGLLLEMKYRDKAPAYFGRVLRKVRPVSFQDIEEDLEKLPDYERNDVLLLDLLVCGYPRTQPDAPEVWLAIEVSAVVDRNDVERAQRRAAVLKRAGYRAIPAVAGEKTTEGGESTARAADVLLLQDGRVQFWDKALSKALAG